VNENIFGQLRGMWEHVDPMPEGLENQMIAVLAAEDLDMEYELLALVERDTTMAGARSTTHEAPAQVRTSKLEFSNGTVTVLLRIAAQAAGECRIDAWVTSDLPFNLRLSVRTWVGDKSEIETTTAGGRASFQDVPHGLARLWLTADHGTGAKPFATPLFEI